MALNNAKKMVADSIRGLTPKNNQTNPYTSQGSSILNNLMNQSNLAVCMLIGSYKDPDEKSRINKTMQVTSSTREKSIKTLPSEKTRLVSQKSQDNHRKLAT